MSVSCRRDAHFHKITRSLSERFFDENASLKLKENNETRVVKISETNDGFFIEKMMRFLMIFGVKMEVKCSPESVNF